MSYSGKIEGGTMRNHNNKKAFDEMQEKSLGEAGVICTSVAIMYLTIEATYKYVTTRDISNSSWEIILILIICAVFSLVIRGQKEMNLPKSTLGKVLPTEQMGYARNQRIISYVCDSVLFSIALTAITYAIDSGSLFKLLIEAVLLFIISLTLNYAIGERKCRKYEEWEKSLDE